MIQYWYLTVPRQHEIAVHAVHGEVGGDGGLCGGEALGDGGAAEDAARAGGMPEGAGVGVDVGADVGEREEGEDGFDWGVMFEVFGGFYEGGVFGHCGRGRMSAWCELV